MDPASETLASVSFGRFQVLPHRRELLVDGRPVKLGGRAFDVLIALIKGRGAVVSTDALMAHVWPDRIVEGNNLQAQIVALRKAFGAERGVIRTIAGRGYQFTGDVDVPLARPIEPSAATGLAEAESGAALLLTNLLQPVSELIGRDGDLGEILSVAVAHRLVTLTGPGGMGKTRLAFAAARRLLPQFADGVWVAELAPLTDPGLVAGTVAAAVGLELPAGAISPERVASALSGRNLLLVLDNCEHVIDTAAVMAEALLRASPAVQIIATSREPLRAEGEWVYPVPPLAAPAEDAEDEDDPLGYGAVQLFIERARASGARISEDRHVAAVIAAICRRLDGIPLAIELAAARAAALGIKELAARLDDRFRLFTGGRRTALPRHQTLRATLDWSYDLLDEPERAILRRLAVFAGGFSLEGAMAVAPGAEIAPAEVVEGLARLVTKSLIVAELERVARYRLLDTTRAYALEKLGESGEREPLARRHAEFYRDLFERAETETEVRPTGEWLAEYGRQIDNMRAAFEWAFSPNGDASIGVALAAAAVPLWTHLSLLEECRARAAQALARLEVGANRDPRREMKLHAALSTSLMYTTGAAVAEIIATWTKALAIAESLEDTEYQLRSLWGLWCFHTINSLHHQAIALAQKYSTLAANRPDPNDRLIAERMIGMSQYYLGDQVNARRHLERVIAEYATSDHRSHITRFQLDVRVTSGAFLARTLWLQGFPDQAVRVAESSIADALATGHITSLCFALALGACPIGLFVGDLAAVEHYLGMLFDHATRRGLVHWRACGACLQGSVRIRRGDVVTGLPLMRAGFDELGEGGPAFALRFIISLTAEALGHAGQIADGLAVVTEAIERSEHTQECWLLAEWLRIKGELLLMQEAQGAAAAAEDHFRQALDWAHRQGVLSLELRAATSLARLLRDQGRRADANALLQRVYNHFTEGFETADLKAAKALLDDQA